MSSPYQRADLPTVGAATRGSITGAMAAAHPDVREEALRNLHRDQYANNTRNTRDSRWNLWTKLAQQWGLPPLPITTDLVNAIGASLKQGCYRSSPQVFSITRQQHIALVKQPLSMDIELLIKQTLRSIERGLGPPTLKDAFTVEDLASVTCHPHSGPPPPHWIDDTYDCTLATIVCCWWMLRGIEVAAAKREHVWFETTPFGKMAFFTLPCHKTDTIGMCITRSHPCMCADSLAHLCPYHTLEQYIIRTTTQRGTVGTEESFLFPGLNGGAITHEETIQVFRTAIEATGAQLTRPGPQGQLLQRFNEHVRRVSGAQFLTRLGYPMETVQLIGRWGSDAVKRYVQDTPLTCATGSSSARTPVNRIPTQKAVQSMVKKYLEAISGKCWIKNTSTNVVHISGAPQFSTENIHWHTLCGWRHGSSLRTPFWTMPDGNKCQRCFKLQETQAITDINSDEETVWNAPAEAF